MKKGIKSLVCYALILSVLITAIKPQQAKAIAVVDDALIVSTLVTVAAAAGVAVVAGNAYKYWNNQLTAYKEANPDAADGLKGAMQYVKWRLKNKDLKTNVAVTLGETAYTAAQKFFGWWQTEQGDIKPGTQITPIGPAGTLYGVEPLKSYICPYDTGGSFEWPEVDGLGWWIIQTGSGKAMLGVPLDGQNKEITVVRTYSSGSTNTSTFNTDTDKSTSLYGETNPYPNANHKYYLDYWVNQIPNEDVMIDLRDFEYPMSSMTTFFAEFELETLSAETEIVELSPTYNPTADETEDGIATPLQPLPATNDVEISLPVTTIPQTVVDSVDDSLVVPQEAYEELSLAIQDTVAKAVADAVPLAVEQSLAIAVTPPVAGEIEMQGDYTVGGLASVFPFCIPFDLVNMMRSLVAGRRAPRIELPFVIPNLVNYTMVIDLSSFDSVASILRGMEFLAFAVGLAMVTRYLIKG